MTNLVCTACYLHCVLGTLANTDVLSNSKTQLSSKKEDIIIPKDSLTPIPGEPVNGYFTSDIRSYCLANFSVQIESEL